MGLSTLLVLASIAAIVVFGFNEGIDFKGGSSWNFRASGVSTEEMTSYLQNDLGIKEARINRGDSDNFIVRTNTMEESDHKKFGDAIKAKYPNFEEISFESIGPSIGEELRRRSLWAIGLVLLGISLYIAFAFRKVYKPVSSWKYGWVTLVSLLHDVAIPAGLLAVLGYYKGIEIDSNFVVALLVVMGFSVHDTIVVFDRIRENLLIDRGRSEFGEVINKSVNQTLARSINTSLTLILVLIAMYFAGPENLKYFILTLLVGVTTGIYSSIFVASPLLYAWHRFSNRGSRSKDLTNK